MLSLTEFLMVAGLATLTAMWVATALQRVRGFQVDSSPFHMSSSGKVLPDRPAPGTWHTPRHSRFRLAVKVEYEGPDGPGQGTLVNLSRDGWRIRSDRPMSCGTVLALRVYLPQQPVPLDVEKAIVRWTDGTEFGAELISLQPDAASQLSHYLASHSLHSESGHLATVSPFSYN